MWYRVMWVEVQVVVIPLRMIDLARTIILVYVELRCLQFSCCAQSLKKSSLPFGSFSFVSNSL